MRLDSLDYTTDSMAGKSGDQEQDFASVCQINPSKPIVSREDLPEICFTSDTDKSRAVTRTDAKHAEPLQLTGEPKNPRKDLSQACLTSYTDKSRAVPGTDVGHTAPSKPTGEPSSAKEYVKNTKGGVSKQISHVIVGDLENRTNLFSTEEEKEREKKEKTKRKNKKRKGRTSKDLVCNNEEKQKKKGKGEEKRRTSKDFAKVGCNNEEKQKEESEDKKDFAYEILKTEKGKLSRLKFILYTGMNCRKEYLNTKCMNCLRDVSSFDTVKDGVGKNGVDALIVAKIVYIHINEDRNVDLIILSGDRGFQAIIPELFGRRVRYLSLHGNYENSITAEKVVEGPTDNDKISVKTELGMDLEWLERLAQHFDSPIKVVHFVYATSTDVPEKLEPYLEDPKSAILVFMQKGEDEDENEEKKKKLERKSKQLQVYHTEEMFKSDAPLFLLEFAALTLHYRSNLDIEFDVYVKRDKEDKKENAFANVIYKCCSEEGKRDVNIHYF